MAAQTNAQKGFNDIYDLKEELGKPDQVLGAEINAVSQSPSGAEINAVSQSPSGL